MTKLHASVKLGLAMFAFGLPDQNILFLILTM